MNTFRKTIEEFSAHQNTDILEAYRCIPDKKEGHDYSYDKNYENRKSLILELYKEYTKEDKVLLKWLLLQELEGFQYDIPTQTLELCAFMIYRHMEQSDVYDLFDAKFGTGSDAQFSIDIELVFGFDREETKKFLKAEKTNKKMNKEIRKAIKHYESNPNAKFKTREEYIRYFETRKINMIISDLLDMDYE